ncbi:hypothetical protein B0T36_11905 [Nocardia donostiensis]|nr:hypothetical protein B0T36_11905 [Nocardia donostiensis]
MRTFHSWILQAHILRIRDRLTESLQRAGTRHAEISWEVSGGARDSATRTTDTVQSGLQLPEGSSSFSPTDAGRDLLPQNPKELHALWSGLTRAEKDKLYRADPFIGNRPGIPHVDRDFYNRRNLAAWFAQARKMHDAPRLARADALRRCGVIDHALKSPEGAPRHYLTRLEQDFRVAVSVDNPDTAENVVTLVAGTGTNPIGIWHATDRAERIRQAALAVDPNARTSVTTWYGDRPPLPSRVGDSLPARNDAQPLRSHHEGLRATHEGPPSHNTLMGYSSGCTNVGYAAMHPVQADALVFVGGVGTGVERVADLRLAGVDPADMERHVFATVAQHDSIQLMPKVHGPPPTELGATVFTSDTTRGPWASLGWNPDIHGSYFDSNNQSMHNIGLIVTGNGHLVT